MRAPDASYLNRCFLRHNGIHDPLPIETRVFHLALQTNSGSGPAVHVCVCANKRKRGDGEGRELPMLLT